MIPVIPILIEWYTVVYCGILWYTMVYCVYCGILWYTVCTEYVLPLG